MQWPVLMAEDGGVGVASGSGSVGSTTVGASVNGGDPSSGVAPPAAQPPLTDRTSLMDWRTGLADNYRTAPVIQRLNTLDDAARALVEQDKTLGRAVLLPTEEPGTPEHTAAKAKIYAKLGRPETAKDYTLTMPEGAEMDEGMNDDWRTTFHSIGLNQEQVDAIMQGYGRMISRAENIKDGQFARSENEALKALDAEFGPTYPDVLRKANGFFDRFTRGYFNGEGGRLAIEAFNNAFLEDGTRLANVPYVIAAFAEAEARIREGRQQESDVDVPGGNTLENISARHLELTAKKTQGLATPAELEEIMKHAETLSRARTQGFGSRR